jgi:putative membrane protein
MKILIAVMIAAVVIACNKGTEDPNKVNSQDQNFINQAYLFQQTEIVEGQVALNKTSNADVRTFAQRMVTNYRLAQIDLEAVAKKLNYLIDTSAIANSEELATLNGSAFDTSYMNKRLRNEQAMLSQFQNELNAGNNTYVRYYYLNKYLDSLVAYQKEAFRINRSL